MEHLVTDLKQNLIIRRKNEIKRIQGLNTETDKDLILISSGKIIELDFLIVSMEEMIHYFENTKKNQK